MTTDMEVDFPPELEMKIANLVDNGDFENEEDAVRQLVRSGLTAYQTRPQSDEPDEFEEFFEEEPTGPSHDDEYVF